MAKRALADFGPLLEVLRRELVWEGAGGGDDFAFEDLTDHDDED